MTIDEEIKMLTERLAELQKEKAALNVELVGKKLKDTKIKIFGDDQTTWNDVVKTFDCFKKLSWNQLLPVRIYKCLTKV